MVKTIHAALAVATVLVCGPALAEVTTSTDPETQLKSWKLTQGALSLELIQRLPDQTRGFFQARGFSKDIANDIATACVLQTIGKNTQAPPNGETISYHLQDWVVKHRGQTRSIKLKEQWNGEWSDDGVNTASRVAFRWATFPTQQEFEPGGDFNWGMTSFDLAPQESFDLKVVWQQNGVTKSEWIKQIECPADR